MNPIFFGCKQVFLGSIRVLKTLVRDFGLTPARYNMMYAISTSRDGVAQADLRTLLGVSAATISRMLGSLEELGFVSRRPHPRHARHRWVTLTIAGLYHLSAAIADLVDSTCLAVVTNDILSPEPGNYAKGDIAIAELRTIQTLVRERLNDHATLVFAYDP